MKNHLLTILFLIVVCIIAWPYLNSSTPHAAATMPRTPHVTPHANTLSEHTGKGRYNVVGSPSISAAKIDAVLCAAGSPACHTGASLYQLGVKYGIDPAFALAFFNHESGYGLNGVARYSLSLGNLRCIESARCVNDYAYFDSWEQGYEAWYILISGPIYVGRGLSTVEAIIPVYAPPADSNDDSAYIASVEQMIDLYRSAA